MIIEGLDELPIGKIVTLFETSAGGQSACAKVLRRATFEEYIADVCQADPEFEKNAHLYADDRGLYHYEVSVD